MEIVKYEDISHVATALLGYTLNLAIFDAKICRFVNRYNDRSIFKKLANFY
jgi:hypothetical protein